MAELWSTKRIQDEAARRGRPVSQEYLQRLCRDGVIRQAQKPARDWLVPATEAERWLDSWVDDSK